MKVIIYASKKFVGAVEAFSPETALRSHLIALGETDSSQPPSISDPRPTFNIVNNLPNFAAADFKTACGRFTLRYTARTSKPPASDKPEFVPPSVV